MALHVLCTYSRMLLQEHFEVTPGLDLSVNDDVVIDTRRGLEVGRVAADPGSTRMKRNEPMAGKVIRKATREDLDRRNSELLRVRVPVELKAARDMSRELDLDMHFVDIEKTLDEKKTIFYFTAPQRVDFRELVKQLASRVDGRVELRQIGARDVARLTGDVGSCGEELCCKTFLIDFMPVSMKMAKNQNLSLETGKISGMCGRLKCCLKYEDELYTKLRKTMPRRGQPVIIKESSEEGWVMNVSILEQTLTVKTQSERLDLHADSVDYDQTMTEREIRSWQKDRRRREKEAWEERQRAKQERKDNREKRNAAKANGDSGSDNSNESDEPTSRSESVATEEQAKPERTEGSSTDNSGEDGDKPKRRRRRGRGRRRKRSGGGSSSGDEGGKGAAASKGDGEPAS